MRRDSGIGVDAKGMGKGSGIGVIACSMSGVMEKEGVVARAGKMTAKGEEFGGSDSGLK